MEVVIKTNSLTKEQLQSIVDEAYKEAVEEIVDGEQKYYIRQEGYCGNALYWWPENKNGYVTDIRKAGKFTKEEAERICKRESDTAYRVEYIDNLLEGQKLIIDAQYVDGKEQLFKN